MTLNLTGDLWIDLYGRRSDLDFFTFVKARTAEIIMDVNFGTTSLTQYFLDRGDRPLSENDLVLDVRPLV